MKCCSKFTAFHSPTGALLSDLMSGVTSRRVKGRVGTRFIVIPHAEKTIRLLRVKADDLTFVRVHQKRYFYSSRDNEIRPQAPSRLPTGS